ncbi:unnamed protein product [Cyberlindnera jadinii]|uniref:Wings apart-like protein C-terminal domain-containing protein n=1 Tax=Cyberlindnera jadinii (strain ATCC 18201 / CBS 1600 / BCRC 20928 / JCM 3617 / NBRC 0987 / NRRL Y-1542) TaxID=983966 RepID=A0A0H5C6R4_CYBJN|nr:unnamed protein product [Cyberlindnera jadinii]
MFQQASPLAELRRSPRLKAKSEALRHDVSSVEHSPTRRTPERRLMDRNSQLSTPSPKLNRLFVESQLKPRWSPSLSPQTNRSHELRTSSSTTSPITQKLLALSTDGDCNERVKSDSGVADEWDFLDVVDEAKAKRTTLKLSLTPSREHAGDECKEIIKVFEHQMQASNDHDTKGYGAKEEISNLVTESPNSHGSPRINRSKRTYGAHRSFLVRKTKSQSEGDESPVEEDHMPSSEPEDAGNNSTCDLKNLADLRAQGSNAQFVDELSFIMDGIKENPTVSSFLELAMKLSDEQFVEFLKATGNLSLWQYTNADDCTMCYIFAYITSQTGQLDDYDPLKVENIILTLLRCAEVRPLRASKLVRTLFDEWDSHLEVKHSTSYYALSVILENGLSTSKQLVDGIIALMDRIELIDDTESFEMALIIYEKYLSEKDEVEPEFEKVVNVLLKPQLASERTKILCLKVLILMSIKKFDKVYRSELVIRSIDEAISTDDMEVQLLSIGLLINLVEDPGCLDFCSEHTHQLHTLFPKCHVECFGYYSLLIGSIYSKNRQCIESQFDRKEIDRVILELQRFDKSNKLLNKQIESILNIIDPSI